MVVDFAQTVNCVTHLDAYSIPPVSDLLDQVSQYRYFSYIDLKATFHQFHLDPTESHFTTLKLIIVFGNLHAFLLAYVIAQLPSTSHYKTLLVACPE